MSTFDDDQDVHRLLDARLADDSLLDHRPAGGGAGLDEPELVAFVSALRATATVPPPAPRADLAALLRDGLPGAGVATSSTAARSGRGVVVALPPGAVRALRYTAGLGLTAKLALGAGVAAASVTGAATIDAVPDVVQRPASALVAGVVDLVTPGAAGRGAPDGRGGAGDPADDEPGADKPEVVIPPLTPDQREPDGPGGSQRERTSGNGLDRELPDQADQAARDARARAQERAQEAKERAARAEEAKERAAEAKESRPDVPRKVTPVPPQKEPGQGGAGKQSGQGGTKGGGP